MSQNKVSLILKILMAYHPILNKNNGLSLNKKNKVEIWLILLMAIFLTLMILIGVLFYHQKNDWAYSLILGCYLLWMITLLVYYLYSSVIIYLRLPKIFMASILKSSSDEYKTIELLSKFPLQELLFVKQYLTLKLKHLQDRIKIFIGPIPVGIMPIIITLYLIFVEYFIKSKKEFFILIDWSVFFILCIPFLALLIKYQVNKIEHYILYINTAINMKNL